MPGQRNCPPNIGFESGSFDHWECSAGTILRDGSLSLFATSPIPERHTIIINSLPQQVDPFGGFPVNCPNGSGYSVRLGSQAAGGLAESATYTLTIPADNNDFSLIYNYAVVFQNPPHQPWEQPRFTSKVYNVTDNKYIDCGSFEFIASGNLPGFYTSPVGTNVFYKPWSPVTVSLLGLAGKTVRLEFYTNDCAFTQHFGYAYVDVNEECSSSPIAGSTYCGTPKSVTLTAPFGFATYKWYTSDFSQLLGTDNILTISPAPPGNITYALAITPYDGVGCEDTLYSTIKVSSEPFNVNVLSEMTGCTTGADLTSPSITEGSTPGLTYSYYTSLNQTEYVPVPTKVVTSGVYYIKGVNKIGCSEIKPINVVLNEPPSLKITNPEGVCIPQTVDITNNDVTAGSQAGIALSYWRNELATLPLLNPNAITNSGTYYIMGKIEGRCGAIAPVEVKIGAIPDIMINNPTGCGKVDITDEDITTGSPPNINYTYWTDAAATQLLSNPNTVTSSNTYFIKASSSTGCSIVRPLIATVNPLPDFTVTDPKPVEYPITTIDITTSVNQNVGLNYSYWLDSLTKRPVANPKAMDKRGRYFIRATNEYGCSIIKPVNAVIIPPPAPVIYAPNAFTPNYDGINDVFKIKIIGETSIKTLRIYDRWGQIVYDNADLKKNWNGRQKELELPAGVYVWILEGLDTYFKKPFAHKGLITLVK